MHHLYTMTEVDDDRMDDTALEHPVLGITFV